MYSKKKRKENYHNKKSKFCLDCGGLTTNKFCNSSCQNSFYRKEKFKLLLEGKIDATEGTIRRWWKKYLIHLHGAKCMKCNWDKVHPVTGNVPIELNHIDGNSKNNSLINLELICPNCHSLTSNYKSLNIGNGRVTRRLRYKEGKSF
jgi:hypothetical protein